ncbi:MAG TPA: peptidase M19 [Flavobacteriaceae bacterium]|nr:peptidase M19 [Flavobacteriaceae bacterium]
MRTFLMLTLFFFLYACKENPKPNTDDNQNKIKTDSLAIMKDSINLETLDTLTYAKKIHERIITLDTHVDINVKNFIATKNYTQRLESQVNLPKMEEGGLDVAWFIVYTGQGKLTKEGYKKAYANAMSKFDAIHRLTEEIAPDKIELALTSNDVRRINAAGKKIAMIGVENGFPIGTDIANVKKFYDLGARYMSLAHNGHSQLSDSNTGEKDNKWLHNGLSELGKQVIVEMNTYGMMIDLSHPSIEANKQAIALSKAPVIASHSSARALCNHSRNLNDDLLQMIKEKKGVVQAVAFKGYLNKDKRNKRAYFEKSLQKQAMKSLGFTWLEKDSIKKLDKLNKDKYNANLYKAKAIAKKNLSKAKNVPENVNVADFVDHIDYLVDLIGIDHVGISSDFDGGGGIEGWSDASETFNVTLELVKRGYTENQISKLWSGNLLRVLDEVQKVAKEIQSKS